MARSGNGWDSRPAETRLLCLGVRAWGQIGAFLPLTRVGPDSTLRALQASSMDRSSSLKFSLALLLSGATVWAALKATAEEHAELRANPLAGGAMPGESEALEETLSAHLESLEPNVEQAGSSPAVASAQPTPSALGQSSLTGLDPAELARVARNIGGPELGAVPSVPPDLIQTDPELRLPGGGKSYCGPVAISNSLMWLTEQGLDKLAPAGESPRSRQLALVRQISSQRYMGTSRYGGTGPTGVLRGLNRWVKDAGYRVARLEYQGWRAHQPQFSTGIKHPDMHWIAEGLAQGGVAWLHVGWYHRKAYQPGYHRRGGHWLTVASVEQSAADSSPEATVPQAGAPQWVPFSLQVRDSAPYAGQSPTLERIGLERIETEWLFDAGAAFPAKGYLAITGGLTLKRSDDIPIIDGAVVLVLAEAD